MVCLPLLGFVVLIGVWVRHSGSFGVGSLSVRNCAVVVEDPQYLFFPRYIRSFRFREPRPILGVPHYVSVWNYSIDPARARSSSRGDTDWRPIVGACPWLSLSAELRNSGTAEQQTAASNPYHHQQRLQPHIAFLQFMFEKKFNFFWATKRVFYMKMFWRFWKNLKKLDSGRMFL